ncbi:TetR family transcriptional regulator [Actinocorallia aurea]
MKRTPRAEVRRRLLDEAARAFTAHGYTESRIEDIAAAAGFTKGAVYSNFGGKPELFAAVLAEAASTELSDVLADVRDIDDPAALFDRVAHLMARRVVEDTERTRLGLEFAARAARDPRTGAVLAPLRRAQREAAARTIAEVADRTGARPTVPTESAALILHTLTNGLAHEHLADPDAVDAAALTRAFTAALAALFPANRS